MKRNFPFKAKIPCGVCEKKKLKFRMLRIQICKQSFGPKRVQKRGPKKGQKNTVTIYNIAIADSTILLSCFSDYISAYWVRPIISCNYLSIVFPLIDVSFFKYVLLFTIYVFCLVTGSAAALRPTSGLIMHRHFGSHLVSRQLCQCFFCFASTKQSLAPYG